jgi:hypothetical protein
MTHDLMLDPSLIEIADGAFAAHNAVIIGHVHVGSESSILLPPCRTP